MKEPIPEVIDHVIQREILKKLVVTGNCKYSELKPDNVESNLFMYHLTKLRNRGIVTKDGNIYSLTTEGGMFVDRANLDRLRFRIQPKIITILAVHSSSGKWLLLERKHEPHMNRVGFPSGKIHYGESLDVAAHRELKEKAGIENIDLKLAGSIIMRFFDKDKVNVINHTIGNVFTAVIEKEIDIKVESKYWKAFWGEESMLHTGNNFKGHEEILNLLTKNKLFIESFDFKSDY